MREFRRWLSLAFRLAAVVVIALALALRDGLGLALALVAVGFLLVPVTWRPKAIVAEGAAYSTSADLVSSAATRFPGQLSVTQSAVVWVPSAYSRKRGEETISISGEDRPAITLRSGPALFDLTVAVTTGNGPERCFRTHQSRHLRRALSKIGQRAGN